MDLLTVILLILVAIVFYVVGRLFALSEVRERERAIRKDAAVRSRAVLSGQLNEQVAPYLPGFPAEPSEARFLGKPIDFVAFRGLDEKKVREIVFIEVKSGKSSLSPVERSVEEAIRNQKVSYEIYRVPEGG